MADHVIDRLVSSLAAGRMGTEEFIQAIEGQVGAIMPSSGKPMPGARQMPASGHSSQSSLNA
jgi:hypothetical protein